MSEVDNVASSKKPKKQPEVEVKKAGKKRWQPTYQTATNFESHLFELKTSKMLKNHSINQEDPNAILPVDHQHFFHTVDSSGKPQAHSTPTGAHFHAITVSWDPETGEPVAKCSGPMEYVNVKGRKSIQPLKKFKAVTDKGDDIIDRHTHDVQYLRTSNVQPRKVNAESVKTFDALEGKREQKIPGIVG